MIDDRLSVHTPRAATVWWSSDEHATRSRDVLMGLYNRLYQGQDVDARSRCVIGIAHPSPLRRPSPPNRQAVVVMIARSRNNVPALAFQTAIRNHLARDDMISHCAAAPARPISGRAAVVALISGQ